MMAKIPEKFMGLLGKFVDSLDYNDLPKGWADNPEIVQAAGELYRDMGTESPFFKAWFGKSKVVDDAGNPLTTYHGSGNWFQTFNDGKNYIQHSSAPSNTIFTNNNRDIANSFIGGNWYGLSDGKLSRQSKDVIGEYDSPLHKKYDWGVYREGGIYPLYMKIENPKILDYQGSLWNSSPYGSNINNEVKEIIKQGKNDGVIAKNIKEVGTADKNVEIPSTTDYVAFDSRRVKSTSNRGTFNPDDPNIYRAIPFAAGGAGAAAALAPGEASASVPAEQYRWPADEPGYVNREPGLGTPLVDVADLATAPIGAATAAGRAASVAAEPFIAYGMDKAGNWLGDKVNGLLGYFGWGE